MNYRRALAIIKDLLDECNFKDQELLTDFEKEALKTACKALKKSIYAVEVTNNDWK